MYIFVFIFACVFFSPAVYAQYDLMCLYQEAQINDSILQAAKENQLSIRQKLPLARAELLPVIDFTVKYTAEHETNPPFGPNPAFGSFHINQYDLTLRQPVLHFEHWKKYAKATAQVKQANAAYTAAEQDLMIRLASAYFGVLEAIDVLHFSKASVAAFAKFREQTEERYKAGLIAITDFEIAKAQHDNAVAKEIAAANEVSNQKERLRAIVGHQVDELLPLREDIKFAAPEPQDIEQWVTTALAQNFLLQAGRFGTKAAKDTIKINEYEHLPKVDIIGGINRTATLQFLPSPTSVDSSIGVEIKIPIFQGAAINYRTRQAIHDYLRTDRDLETLYRSVESDTRQSFLGVLTQISQIAALKQAVISNQSALAATSASFNVGTRTIVDVLNAQRDLILAQQTHAQARYRYITQSLSLKQAAGILCCDDLRHINAWLINKKEPQ